MLRSLPCYGEGPPDTRRHRRRRPKWPPRSPSWTNRARARGVYPERGPIVRAPSPPPLRPYDHLAPRRPRREAKCPICHTQRRLPAAASAPLPLRRAAKSPICHTQRRRSRPLRGPAPSAASSTATGYPAHRPGPVLAAPAPPPLPPPPQDRSCPQPARIHRCDRSRLRVYTLCPPAIGYYYPPVRRLRVYPLRPPAIGYYYREYTLRPPAIGYYYREYTLRPPAI
eukprot:700316-Prorocentrum_minimum.AAC.1